MVEEKAAWVPSDFLEQFHQSQTVLPGTSEYVRNISHYMVKPLWLSFFYSWMQSSTWSRQEHGPQERGGKEVFFFFFLREVSISHYTILCFPRDEVHIPQTNIQDHNIWPPINFPGLLPFTPFIGAEWAFSFFCTLCIHSRPDLSLCEFPLFLSAYPGLTCSCGLLFWEVFLSPRVPGNSPLISFITKVCVRHFHVC